MTSAAAAELLHLIGKDSAPQGIVIAEDLPAAIHALEQAIGRDDAERLRIAAADRPGEAGSDDAVDDTADRAATSGSDDEPVSLRRRAWPLLDQLRQSSRHGVPVVWETRTLPSAVPLRAAGYV
ncbi:DUF1840 domain-containing protein [Leptothrix discophora]|uniref:DUF1840 domain-containing protein n=1 Tax=Leptothrix discophora TaxID=89 RepID=A0ABT9G8J1_LEPDI|nr:DUF1840 domain-containing protein [Leptothrix discophora]MDP4302796.1 DUF1840 domain-containing protein [Leptothrix discophora]